MYHVDPKHFYVTLLSNTSKNLYPDYSIAAFTAELARTVELGSSDNWEVGVCELSYPWRHYRLISPQYMGRAQVRCMRTFIYSSLSGQHVPGEKRTFKSIRIEILQLMGKPVEFKSITTPSKVVLHFRRVSPW